MGAVSLDSEKTTNIDLYNIYNRLVQCIGKTALAREVEKHLRNELHIADQGMPDLNQSDTDQIDQWEFLIRNGTSFYSDSEKATVTIRFEVDDFRPIKSPPQEAGKKDIRTRYSDLKTGTETGGTQANTSTIGAGTELVQFLEATGIAIQASGIAIPVFASQTSAARTSAGEIDPEEDTQ